MDINRLGSSRALGDYQKVEHRTSQVLAKLSSGRQVSSAADDPVRWGDAARLKSSAVRIQSHTENLNRAASSVRIALGAMEVGDVQLVGMSQALQGALMAPAGSDARRQELERYNTLHSLTDDLANQKDLGAQKLLDDPARFEGAGALEVAAGEGGFEITLRHQPIHLGAEGLDLPRAGAALPSDPSAGPVIAEITDASDESINAMARHLERAREVLSQREAALSANVSMLTQTSEFNTTQAAERTVLAEGLEAADLELEAMLAQSLSLRSNLAIHGLTGFSETRKMALRLIQ